MLKKQLAWVLGALLILAVVAPAAHAKHWVMLGTAHVDKSEDHKTIHVGSEAGQFHNIQLRVSGGAVDFQRVVVHFGDGTHEELAITERVRSGGKTQSSTFPVNAERSIALNFVTAKRTWTRAPKSVSMGLDKGDFRM